MRFMRNTEKFETPPDKSDQKCENGDAPILHNRWTRKFKAMARGRKTRSKAFKLSSMTASQENEILELLDATDEESTNAIPTTDAPRIPSDAPEPGDIVGNLGDVIANTNAPSSQVLPDLSAGANTENMEIVCDWTLQLVTAGGSDQQVQHTETDQSQEKSISDRGTPKKTDTNYRKPPGKPRSNVWESFDTPMDAEGKPDRSLRSTCKKCKRQVSSQADRLTKHLSSCQKSQQSEPKTPAQMSLLNAQMSEASGYDSPREGMQQSLHKYFKSVNATDKNKLDFKLGGFIFASNLSFSVVSHPQFKEFVASLNPAYNLPSREKVRTTILDAHYQRVLELRKSQIENKVGVLLQDGWSTNQNKPVLSHCLATPSGAYFLSAESTGTEKKDSPTCFKYLQKAINYCTETLHCKIVGIVTDNCSTMTSMQALVREEYPDMEVYGCNAHLFNLIGEKFTDKDLADKIRHVQTFIRNHHFTTGRLDEMGGKRPILPGTTRWNSQVDSFLNYLENHSKYLGIVRELCKDKDHRGKAGFQKLKDVVEDNSIYNSVEDAIKLLQPVCVALDEMQKEQSTLADAAEMWITLGSVLPESITMNDYFLKQMNLGLTQASLAAHILHPKYKGHRLTSEQKESGLSWISDRNPYFVIPCAALREEVSDFFYKQYQNEAAYSQMTAISWWKAASKDAVPKAMLEMVTNLFALPASTGAIERNFSTLGQIMSDQRNKISVETASKLCAINNHYKMESELAAKRQPKKRNFSQVE